MRPSIAAKAGNTVALISPVRTAPAKFPWTLASGDIIGRCQSLYGFTAPSIDQERLALGKVDLWDVDDNTTARSPLG
jgi:hypothetical protein